MIPFSIIATRLPACGSENMARAGKASGVSRRRFLTLIAFSVFLLSTVFVSLVVYFSRHNSNSGTVVPMQSPIDFYPTDDAPPTRLSAVQSRRLIEILNGPSEVERWDAEGSYPAPMGRFVCDGRSYYLLPGRLQTEAGFHRWRVWSHEVFDRMVRTYFETNSPRSQIPATALLKKLEP